MVLFSETAVMQGVLNMRLLFIFMDGLGLGTNDINLNPLAKASMRNLEQLLGGKKLVIDSLKEGPIHNKQASLVALDACLGVEGLPQSATGQTVLLTGVNVPAEIGYHYGPKPNPDIAQYLDNNNLFYTLQKKQIPSALLNAYPNSYFRAIQSGRRMYSAIPHAVNSAGIPLKNTEDLKTGSAIAADLTAEGWHTHLLQTDIPLLKPEQAGERLAHLARKYHFSLFEYWLSDYAGHKQLMEPACSLLVSFDQALGGLVNEWRDEEGLVLLTSDHGNLEDLSTRRHTFNPVPALLIGDEKSRHTFLEGLSDLTGITPKILDFLGVDSARSK
jgi:2,3-bisphosphoglycerate-independent phosphoglycerate mutase